MPVIVKFTWNENTVVSYSFYIVFLTIICTIIRNEYRRRSVDIYFYIGHDLYYFFQTVYRLKSL